MAETLIERGTREHHIHDLAGAMRAALRGIEGGLDVYEPALQRMVEAAVDWHMDLAAPVPHPAATDPSDGGVAGVGEHCETCICGRRAPVQGEYRRGDDPSRAPGTIAWEEHVEAYTGYAARYGTSQSAETLAARGGFGYRELQEFLGHDPTTWVVRGR